MMEKVLVNAADFTHVQPLLEIPYVTVYVIMQV
jgi:hypothetical protein